MTFALIACVLAIPGLAIGVLCRALYVRGYDRWVVSSVVQVARRARRRREGGEVHLLLCITDHFEPRHGRVDDERARGRVDRWVRDYPANLGGFRDSDGRPPRYTFFFPVEEYVEEHVAALEGLCAAGFGELEIHLHHDDDTSENLRRTLLEAKHVLAERHGLLSRDRRTGEIAYGFIHGNWALDNSRPDGRWCGVNDELDVLRETGCYADFTFPSAPSRTQPRKINSIYYAVDDPGRPGSHDTGIDVGLGPARADGLMLIQGPLLLDWRRRRYGLIPMAENACIQASQPPSLERLDLWLKAAIQVPARPDWYFVKLHAHGAPEESHEVLLGEPMQGFHRALAERAAGDARFHYHYVTARELYNLVKAAEAGWRGPVADALDHELLPTRAARRPAGGAP